MKIIIVGPRDYFDYDVLCDAIKRSGFKITEVVSGGANGVDKMGERWAKENKVKCTIFPAEWDNLKAPGCIIKVNKWKKEYNANAGFARNQKMADYSDGLIAIITGSHGTADMAKRAKSGGLKVYEHDPETYCTDEDYAYVF